MSFTSFANDIIGDIEAPYALIETSYRNIGGVIPDVTIREINADENVITANPIETGGVASDHIFANPAIVEMVCGFSDSLGGSGYSQAIYQGLLAIRDTRQPFPLFTGKRFYGNMVFAGLAITTDENSEHALFVTARFQQVTLTSTTDIAGDGQTAANQADPASTASESNMGQQSLQSYSGLSGFSTSGPVATTGTTIGAGGNAGGGLSFDSYMSGFGA